VDIKDFLLQNENSLPTLTDTLGSPTTSPINAPANTTGVTMEPGSLPSISTSSGTLWKFGVSSIVGLLGMYYLAAGKKQSDFGKMMLGAGLTLASFFLF
jgi:hypothetical protein